VPKDKPSREFQATSNEITKIGTLPRPVQSFWMAHVFLVAIWAVAILFRWFVLHKGDDLMSPFFGTHHLYDLKCFWSRFSYFHSEAFFHHGDEPFMYPPLMALVYKFFYHFGDIKMIPAFYSITMVLVGAMSMLVGRAMHRRGASPLVVTLFLGSVLLLSYPLWFEYQLGNMEICVFILVAAGVWAFLRGRGYTSAACFGLAAALKIFPRSCNSKEAIPSGCIRVRCDCDKYNRRFLACMSIAW
jgi:hypothetical protein